LTSLPAAVIFFYFVVRSCLGKLQYSADRLVAETGLIGQVQTELFGRVLGERKAAKRFVGGTSVNGAPFSRA